MHNRLRIEHSLFQLESRSIFAFLVFAYLLYGSCDISNAQVELTGLSESLLNNALIHMELDDEQCEAPSWRVEDQFARAEDEIRTALEAFGYYAADITSTLGSADACWTAQFDVTPGVPVRLREVDISIVGVGSGDAAFISLIEAADLAPEQLLHHGRYTTLKNELLDLSQERGYIEALFTTATIDIYPAEQAADIALQLDAGPRYSFGEIAIDQAVLEPNLLERYYAFEPGDPYDRNELNSLYLALVGSGYFEEVDVRPLPEDTESKSVPIAIRLTPAPRRSATYGVGFSTDTGPRLRAGATNRRFDTRGTQIGVNGQLSPVISEVLLNYRFPYGDPRSEWVSFDAGIKHEDTETAVSDSVEFGVRRVIARSNGWQETQFLNSLVENFEVGTEKSRSRLLTPGISWLKVNADNALRPERGFRVGLELTGANDTLGSDTSFLQAMVDGKWIHSFSNSGRLLVRGRVGAIWEDDFVELPPSMRFFAGGDNSIRGYEFESLGPLDIDGNVIGGNRLAVASVEYEHPVRERWSVAFFVDAGNAFKDRDFDTRSGAGVGFRWQSPLGPIRVDVGFPLNGNDRGARLHVSLGADL